MVEVEVEEAVGASEVTEEVVTVMVVMEEAEEVVDLEAEVVEAAVVRVVPDLAIRDPATGPVKTRVAVTLTLRGETHVTSVRLPREIVLVAAEEEDLVGAVVADEVEAVDLEVIAEEAVADSTTDAVVVEL